MNISDDGAQQDRLRPPPVERFAGKSHAFDLHAQLTQLRAEDHPSQDGHRQITIFHRPPVAHVLFAFEPGGRLEKHSARGQVTIHVLEGRILVDADGQDHDLRTGHILILDPEVMHDVRAPESSAMLLTVDMSAGSSEA